MPQFRQMLAVQWQRPGIRVPLLVAVHRRPLSARPGIALPASGILVPQRRIVSRASHRKRDVVHLPTQLYRLALRERDGSAQVLRRDAVVSQRRDLLPANQRRGSLPLPGGIQRPQVLRQHGRLSPSVHVPQRRHLPGRNQQFHLHLQRVPVFLFDYFQIISNQTLTFFLCFVVCFPGTRGKGAKPRSITACWTLAKMAEPVSTDSAVTFASAPPDSAATNANWKWPPG